MSICYFCGQNETIERSHIIPAYFFRWLKKNSFTNFMRSPLKNNKRVQDGIYLPLLCHDCEEEFSKYENSFKKNIFDKILNNQNKILLNPDDKKFIYSLIWRVVAMYYYFKKDYLSYFNENELEKIPFFHNFIKDAYYSGTSNIIKTHLLPFNEYIYESVFINDNTLFNKVLYIQRAIGCDFYPWENERYFIVIIKLPLFVIICEMNNRNNWNDVQIEHTSEIYFKKAYKLPEYIYWLLRMEYGKYCKVSENKMNEKDNAKIMRMISKNTLNEKSLILAKDLLLKIMSHDNKI